MNAEAVEGIQEKLKLRFQELAEIQRSIRDELAAHADGKNLKGNELVGWLGEIYAKSLLGGQLVNDSLEHDVETPAGWLVSVKTRKGWNSGWRQTSAIPKTEGSTCPTHLAFVHLDDEYGLDRIWLFEWQTLLGQGRFKKHIVRGEFRSYIFSIDEAKDVSQVVYRAATDKALQLDSLQSSASTDRTRSAHTGHGQPMSVDEKRIVISRIRGWSMKPDLIVHRIIGIVVRAGGAISREELTKKIAQLTSSKNPAGAVASLLTSKGNAYGRVFEEIDGKLRLHPEVEYEVRAFNWRS